jgi:hypothetical protein
MAKQPAATVERFRISAETSKDAMGHILAELTKMGLQNIGYELITDIVTFRQNGQRKPHNVTGDNFAREFIQQHEGFTTSELVDHFKKNERTPGSAYTSIRNLITQREIQRLSPGQYQRIEKLLALPAPSKANGKAKHRSKKARYEITNRDVILKRIKGRARFTVKELQDHFTNTRRNPKSVSAVIDKLLRDKAITRIESGVYAWSKSAAKVKSRTPTHANADRDAPVVRASPGVD